MAEKFPNINGQPSPANAAATGGRVTEDAMVTEVKDRLEEAWRWDRENRRDAHEDLKFVAGDQWPQTVRQERQAKGRPVITINKLPPMIRQVQNDIRQNPPAIKVRPVGSERDKDVADIYSGMIRHIEHRSSASWIYSTGSEHQVACGMGHWRINTEFVEDSVFEKEIRLDYIPNPLNVYYDPASTGPVRKDRKWTVVTELWPIRLFRETYPGAKEVDTVIRDDNIHEGGLFWRIQESIRVAEYWYKVPKKRRLMAFEDEFGEVSTFDVTDLRDEDLFFLPQPIGERMADGHEVKQILVSGAEVLEGPDDWAGKDIPIIPVIGSEVPLQTKTIRFGLVRFMRDPQQLYNYFRSQAAESIANAPKSPILATPDMVGPYKKQWDSMNRENRPYLLYKPDKNAPKQSPERIPPPDQPAALWNEQAIATDDMKATSGIHDANQGIESNETSGKAILARQREGDTANFHFSENLVESVQYTGEQLIDLIPRIYDTERQMAILKEDDTEEFVTINQEVMADDGEPMLLNNLSDGRFAVRVATGPSYTTKRLEAADSMVEFIRAVPGAAGLIGDLIAKNMDWPGAEEMAERLKNAIPEEIRGPDPDAEPEPPDPNAEAMNQLLMRGQEAEIVEQEARAEKTMAEAEKAAAEIDKTDAQTQQILQQLATQLEQIAAQMGLTEAQTDKTDAEADKTRAEIGVSQEQQGQIPA